MDEENKTVKVEYIDISIGEINSFISHCHFLLYLRTLIPEMQISDCIRFFFKLPCLAGIAFRFIARRYSWKIGAIVTLRAKRNYERASNTLDLIACVSRLDRDIFSSPQLRRSRRGKITGKNGEMAETRRRRSGARIMTPRRAFPRYLCAVG